MSGALRVLFAELGFEVDDAGLKRADTMARELAQRMLDAYRETEQGVVATVEAIKHLGGVQRDIAAGFEELKQAAEAALPSIVLDEDLGAQAESLARITDEVKRLGKAAQEEQEKAAAAQQFGESAEGRAAARARLAASARKERDDHAAKKAFDESDEGKAHAAWKRLRDAEEAAKKPVEGWADLVKMAYTTAADRLGRRLPQALQNLAGRMGIAKGDFAAMGRLVLGTTAALAALAIGAVHSSVALAATAEELRDTARESRVTTSELQEFRHAGAISGVGADRMAAGVANLAQNLRSAEMRMGGNGVGGQLRRLGIDMRDASGQVRPTADIMDDLAVAFERVPSPVRRARMATQLFGESGRRMLDVLHTGPGGLRALREEMEQLGGGVTPEAVAASREFTQAQERLSRASDSLRSVLAVSVLPVLSWMTTKAAELGGWFARLTRGTHLVRIAMIALGVTAAAVALATIGAWGPVVAPFVAAAAAIAAVGLVLDDVWTFIEGGDSALGRFIDSMFGAGTSAQFARALREEWENVVGAVERAIAAVADFFGLTEAPAVSRGDPATAGRRPRPAPGASGAPGGRPQRGGRPAPQGAPSGRVQAAVGAVDARAAATVAVPAQRAVAAPAQGARTTHVIRSVTVAPGAIVVQNATDPEAVGRVVRRELAAAQAQNDGDHALGDGDDDGGTS